MSDFKVVDKKGEWILNVSEARIPDYSRDEVVIIEPGVPTRIVMTAYLDGQPTLRRIEDPTEGEIRFKEVKAEPAQAAPAKAAAK